MPLSLINGQAESCVPVTDRALAYGDGVFETIAVEAGHLCLWDDHAQRIRKGCEQLKIAFTQYQELAHEAQQLATQCSQENAYAVVKIIISAGSGTRGYYRPADNVPLRIVTAHPLDAQTCDEFALFRSQGIAATVCATRLSSHPSLCGIKHNNRLEQVLARNEWSREYQEGVMLNSQDNVIEGTMSNLFIVRGQALCTPALQQCGVMGIMREWIIRQCAALDIPVQEGHYSLDDLLTSDGLFFCNSVIKAWPVKSLKGHTYDVALSQEILKQLPFDMMAQGGKP